MNPPAGTLRFSHLGVAVPSIEQALPLYRDLFGYAVLSGPFDDPQQGVRVCFVGKQTAGEVVLELVAPLADDSPVQRMLEKGVAAYHVCYEAPDIDQALNEARARSCLVVANPIPAVAFGGRRIAWFYTPTRQLVELVEQ